MSEDHAFLAAIRAQPEDAVLRLVYADWLEERGDERHELIRVETAMRAVPIWSDEFQRLKPSRARLRKTLPSDWLAAMDYLPKHRPMFGTLPPTAAERWRLAEEFIDIWHGGLKPGDGYAEGEVAEAEVRLGVRLPQALREWYLWAGKRGEVWGGEGSDLSLPRWSWEGDRLELLGERDGTSQWYLQPASLDDVDPPVFSIRTDREASPSLTEFALAFMLFTRMFQCISCEAKDVSTDEARSHFGFQTTHFSNWDWSGTEATLLESADMLAIACEADLRDVSCRTEAAYAQLVADFGERIVRLD